MKAVGIQIDGNKIILGVLEKYDDGKVELSDLSRKLELKNHLDNSEVENFKNELYAALDAIGTDKIAFVTRNPKGQKSASPISFKLEGILQLYKKTNVQNFWPATTAAYYKKNNYNDLKKYNYQDKALRLAYYLL